MLRVGEERRKIGQKKRARVSNLNSWSNNTQKLPNSFADSNRFALFKLFLPKSKRINLAFLLQIHFNLPITFIGF